MGPSKLPKNERKINTSANIKRAIKINFLVNKSKKDLANYGQELLPANLASRPCSQPPSYEKFENKPHNQGLKEEEETVCEL